MIRELYYIDIVCANSIKIGKRYAIIVHEISPTLHFYSRFN